MAVQETAVEVGLPANVADDARATLQCTIVNLRDVSFQRRLFREDLAAFATCAPGTRILKYLQNSQNGTNIRHFMRPKNKFCLSVPFRWNKVEIERIYIICNHGKISKE